MEITRKIKIASTVLRGENSIKGTATAFGVSASTVRNYMDAIDANIKVHAATVAAQVEAELRGRKWG